MIKTYQPSNLVFTMADHGVGTSLLSSSNQLRTTWIGVGPSLSSLVLLGLDQELPTHKVHSFPHADQTQPEGLPHGHSTRVSFRGKIGTLGSILRKIPPGKDPCLLTDKILIS